MGLELDGKCYFFLADFLLASGSGLASGGLVRRVGLLLVSSGTGVVDLLELVVLVVVGVFFGGGGGGLDGSDAGICLFCLLDDGIWSWTSSESLSDSVAV